MQTTILLFTVIWGLTTAAVQIKDGRPLVQFSHGGRLSGVKEKQWGKEYFSFRNIPFAQPPVGNLRFRDPLVAEPWTGERDGKGPSPFCTQLDFDFSNSSHKVYKGQEDCLYLNVYTPLASLESWASLPVFVWVHGGSFKYGGAEQYHNATYPTAGVIFVPINHRLGPFGFFSTDDDEATGNYGLKDVVMALQWVRGNIAQFGGDPNRVTIGGASAGAILSNIMLYTPYAEGLFSRMILQSASALANFAIGDRFNHWAKKMGTRLNCSTNSSSEIVECLQTVDYIRLIQEYTYMVKDEGNPINFAPRIDGDFLPAHPATLTRLGCHARVPLMMGITRNDGGQGVLYRLESSSFLKDINSNFSSVAPRILKLREETKEHHQFIAEEIFKFYTGGLNYTAEKADKIEEMSTSMFFTLPAERAGIFMGNRMPVFLYNLSYRGEFSMTHVHRKGLAEGNQDVKNIDKWVLHQDDHQYLYDDNRFEASIRTNNDLSMRRIMIQLWVNFISNGNPTPNGEMGFTWSPANQDDVRFLGLNQTPSMLPDTRSHIREFHSNLPTLMSKLFGKVPTRSNSMPTCPSSLAATSNRCHQEQREVYPPENGSGRLHEDSTRPIHVEEPLKRFGTIAKGSNTVYAPIVLVWSSILCQIWSHHVNLFH